MSLITYSKFFYGHTITEANRAIDFNEGGSELQATLNVGEYTLTSFLAEIKRALDAVGALAYTVTVNRTTRVITISAGSNFSLLTATGSRAGTSAYSLMGYTGSNRTGASTYAGNVGSGSVYEPQFFLQDYVSPDENLDSVDEKVNEAPSGIVEVVKFGDRQFMECNIDWVTDKNPSGHPLIKVQASGKANLIAFMTYLRTKAPVEFMPDMATPATFYPMLLESTRANKAGTGFKLKEKIDEKAPGYFETELLTFRVVA